MPDDGLNTDRNM